MKSTYKVERRVGRREGSILQGRLGKCFFKKRGGARFRFMEKQMQREG